MKVRRGFVSNSSTTSFCIYGVSLDEDEWPMSKLYVIQGPPFVVQGGQDYSGLNYFGRSWSGIGDDETGAQFKKYVEDKVKEIFGEGHQCYTIEEAWYDG